VLFSLHLLLLLLVVVVVGFLGFWVVGLLGCWLLFVGCWLLDQWVSGLNLHVCRDVFYCFPHSILSW